MSSRSALSSSPASVASVAPYEDGKHRRRIGMDEEEEEEEEEDGGLFGEDTGPRHKKYYYATPC